MKFGIVALFYIFMSRLLCAQEVEPVATSPFEQQLERFAEESETEDDEIMQRLEFLRKHPVNLNRADVEELKQLYFLTDLQITNFLRYRNFFGRLIHKYELQAIPTWDLNTIRKILPYIHIDENIPIKEHWKTRIHSGEHHFLIRFSQVMEKAEGYKRGLASRLNYYSGSRSGIRLRYKYVYKNLLQFGFLAEKDPGEQLFKGTKRMGFDFYSFHLFARKIGIMQSLAIGDFSVNIGQGLIQWQSLAFKKGGDALSIKRQSAVLLPYSSSGEYNFHRGAAITLKKSKWEFSLFASLRKLDADKSMDTVHSENYVSSVLYSGYHRTASEMADRGQLKAIMYGSNISYKTNGFDIGLNTVRYHFSLPIVKSGEPYNFFASIGKEMANYSIDFSYTYRNVHLFGEAAIDKNFNKAILGGLLASIDQKIDVGFAYRNIQKQYHSLFANAFTENTLPVNEKGIYAGMAIRPFRAWRFDIYADFFQFPWLKYRVDAPGYGREYGIRAIYSPNKKISLENRYRYSSVSANVSSTDQPLHVVLPTTRHSLRSQLEFQYSPSLTFRSRVEVLWWNKEKKDREQGFLSYSDLIIRSKSNPIVGYLRLQYFETNGYNSRIYAYENDVLYSSTVPAFFDKGFRYYFLLKITPVILRKISRGADVQFWFRWAQTLYRSRSSVGSGLDEIEGKSKSEFRFQLIIGWP